MLLQKFQISAQYLKTTQIAVTILDVHNPAHFVVRESPTLDASTEAKHFIEAEDAMQKYYQSIEPGFFQLPLKDSVVVVLFKNKFYRAKVIRILNLSAGYLFKVYLVDYGFECSVDRNCIYEIEKDFLVHPFQALDFKLLGLEPISLVMDAVQLNFSYGPVSSWDSSADTFVADILKNTCSAYIEVQAIDREHIFGKLFICLNDNLTRCLNEELISNKFAQYNEDIANKVQNIKKYLETGNVDVEMPSNVEPISSASLNPKQMSSTSEIEPDFFGSKMMFVRPSDGKIISQSCLGEDTSDDKDNMFDKLMYPDSEKVSDSKIEPKTLSPPKAAENTSPAKVSLESISPSSASGTPSETQNVITQRRLLKLRQSYENKLKSSKHLDEKNCAGSENVSSALGNTEINATAGACGNDTQQFTNKSPVKNDEKSDTISPVKLNKNTLGNSDSSGLSDVGGKSNVDTQEKSIESSPRQNETQDKSVIHKRFLKLQQICRRKSEPPTPDKDAGPSNSQNPPYSPSKEEMKLSSDETPVKDNLKKMQETNDFTKPIKNPESPISSTNETSNISPTLERQKDTREPSIIHKRFLKLQQRCRKKSEPSSSHKDADSSNIRNPPYSPSREEMKSSSDETQMKDGLKKMQETNDFTKKPESPISSTNETPREKVNKSPSLESSENNWISNNSSPSHRRPIFINQKSNTSDSEDPFSRNNKKNENNSLDNDLVESFIELSTQLQCSQNKHFVFSDKSFWEKQNVPVLQIKTGISSPICTVKEANFSEYLTEVLKDLKFKGPSFIQSAVWPAMAKKQSIIMVSPPHSGKTISYILPLISYLTSKNCCLPRKKGPFIIILCCSWVKAANINNLLQLFLGGLNFKISSLCTHGGIYMNNVKPVVNNCDILIATPFCLLEFLKNNCISLDRCEHFILEDGKRLITQNKKELKSIFVFLTDTVKESRNHPQIVLCARHWNKNFEIIKDKLMFSPAIFFTSSLEAMIYAKVPIFAHVCKSTEKKTVLLNALPKAGKVVICTRNSQVAKAVHHFLRWEDVRCFLVNEDMEQYITDEVIKDWKSARSMTSSHCLIVTDPIFMKMSINAVDCLVHYDIPLDSRLQFENRFSCIFESFNKPDSNSDCTCHIFIDESEYRFAPQLVEIIENAGGTPSKELIDIAQNRDQDENLSGSLCHYLKAFGFCEKRRCQSRHSIDVNSDKPQMVPSQGDIQALVVYIIDPSHYYVRLLKYLDPVSNKTISLTTTYAQIGFQLKDFYKNAPEELVVKSPVVGNSYVLAENNLFYRIKILDVVPAHLSELPIWKILYLDEGWVKFSNQPKLFKMSDEVNLPDPLAVEVYVCKISPPDSCFDWNPQTTHLVKDLIGGKKICGKIALCMGKVLWLDPIVLRVELANASEYVNLFKLNQRLLECGHVRPNKNHLCLLKKACDGKIPLPQVTKANIPKDESPKLETSIRYAFLDCDNYEDVYVSSVVSPQQFYVQRAKFVDCLDNLLDKINEQVESRKLKKAFTLQKGMPCIAPFPEDARYYRAIITDIISFSEVQTFYVDFGDSGKVSRNSLYLLPSEFLLLPFQAIECELAGVTASHGGWTDSAANTLVSLTRDEAGDMKALKLKAYSKTKGYDGGNHYLVDLWFSEKNLSEQLLQMGLGIPSNIPVVTSTEELDDNFDLSSHKTVDSYDKNCTSTDEGLDSDDKDIKALFYSAVENMIMKQYNIVPQSGATVTEVSTDEEEILKTIKKPFLPTSEASENFGKLLTKFKPISEDVSSAEGSKSLKPLIIWWDTTEELNIQINLKDIKLYQFDITDEGLYFNSVIANNQYTATEKFYAEICSSGAKTYQSREGINMVAKKKLPSKWPHLTKEKTKCLHIKYDLIHLEDSDAEEQDPAAKFNLPSPPYVAEEKYSSTDEDEQYVPLWNEIGQNSNHCDLMS